MKWVTLLNEFKEKVGLTQSPPSGPSAAAAASSPSSSSLSLLHRHGNTSSQIALDYDTSLSREKYDLELDFKRFWEEFRSSNSEKDREGALNYTIDCFCKLVKQHGNAGQIVSMLAETHIFSFVVGRAFVTDIEKIKIGSKTRSLDVHSVVKFFSEDAKDGFSPGSNLLTAIEVLVSGPVDKQSFLESGILCCLIHVLNTLLCCDTEPKQNSNTIEMPSADRKDDDVEFSQVRRLEVEGSTIHIMKALANYPSAAQSLIEDDSLQLLFQMVADGSLSTMSQSNSNITDLHKIQLHRHAMQILGLLLVNDNGVTARYIRKHHLIKVLLSAVKNFKSDSGDPAYTMGIVDLLLQCVELSNRPEAMGVKLREDIHNAHGYQFLVQFALALSSMPQIQDSIDSTFSFKSGYTRDRSDGVNDVERRENNGENQLSPVLLRLLDVLVNLSQTGSVEQLGASGIKTSKMKGRSHRSSSGSAEISVGGSWDGENFKVKDLEAVQTLQDILLKANNRELQAEVLNRMFKIFSSHLENYNLCRELRTIPLFILNMGEFPFSLQEIILKILEYAVTVVNCVPEQELLSLCCLMQQPITSDVKHTILSFFVKLLSFDQQYKKVLREVGVLEVLLDDLKQHKFLLDPENGSANSSLTDIKSESNRFKRHLDGKDVILSSPKLIERGSGKFPIFEIDCTIPIAWDCLVSLIKKAEGNQASFRSSSGVTTIIPFLVSDIHRPGVLRVLSCLISEDSSQAHSDELGVLVDILKSGMVTSGAGHQYSLNVETKCEIMGAVWRILGVNMYAQRTFGECTGFSLLLTALHHIQSDGRERDMFWVEAHIKMFTYLLRLVTAAVCGNTINRSKLHVIMSSHTFSDLLFESGLIQVDFERLIIQLLLEVALEIIVPPFLSQSSNTESKTTESTIVTFPTLSGIMDPDKERVYNASAIRVLIRSLLHFTPTVQLEVLNFINQLARAGPFNRESLASVGCVQLLLELIHPFLLSSSSLLSRALKIIEVLGAYRLSPSELRVILRYIFQMKTKSSGHIIVDMMENLILNDDMAIDYQASAPFVEMDMSKIGHASIQVSLGERTWPPAAGYSFVCWFQFKGFLNSQAKEPEIFGNSKRSNGQNGSYNGRNRLRIFSVGTSSIEHTLYAELYLQEDGILTLATSNSCFASFSGLELVEGRWHHLAVVHSKPNALTGLFQASIAYVYLDGKLRHTGKLGYSPSPVGKPLQVTIGTSPQCSQTSDLTWKLRSCYLFEEVLTSGSIFFMYILGSRYRGLFQDSDLLRFVPNHACGGGSMAILGSLDLDTIFPTSQKLEVSGKVGDPKTDGSGVVWDLERLENLSVQLSGRKLIFAFDGMCTETAQPSGALSLMNLVDPSSAAASPIGGIPRFGRLKGDVYVCRQNMIGDTIRPVGGIATILAFVESANTKKMLHMALAMLAASIHQNPQNLKEMQAYRGYHLLALFLRRRISLFDMQCLEIFFQIAACEASIHEPKKLDSKGSQVVATADHIISFDEMSASKFHDEVLSFGSRGEDDFSITKDSYSNVSELENTDLTVETSNCIVLANADMVEHVLLDWTLWVISPVSIQIALLGFLEHLVSMHRFRNHNLTVLRQINLVQHLLVTLQRGDVEVSVLEKLVVLLGVILEDGYIANELEAVVKFVIMTFDPPGLIMQNEIVRESMGKHVIVRNMLLEMLIDLLVTIKTEDLIEQWHKIVSSKLITYFLDEAVHPTSMRWIMTLLGVCLVSSPTFAIKFRSSGGYQGLMRVLPEFYDSPDIYYILFCLIFGKPIYPRLPEVRMLDFHALLPSDGKHVDLKYTELLESVVAMAKSTFDRLGMQATIAHQSGCLSQFRSSLVVEILEENVDSVGELQGEALMHKTYAARLMGGEAFAPTAATAILRFMVDLAKMCPPFASVCRKSEFLESCIDLYFTCIRAAYALKKAKALSDQAEEKIVNDFYDTSSSQNTFSTFPHDQDHFAKMCTSVESFPQVRASTSSDDANIPLPNDNVDAKKENVQKHLDITDSNNVAAPLSNSLDAEVAGVASDLMLSTDSQSVPSVVPVVMTSANVAYAGTLGGGNQNDLKHSVNATPSLESSYSAGETEQSLDSKPFSHRPSASNNFFDITSRLLQETDNMGYGGGPCSAGATAMLDFLAEVLADFITGQLKSANFVESILEMVPLYVDVETLLVFQGLCLGRVMNFIERRLLRDDEENEKKLDKSSWSINLESICGTIVDRVYMGAFPQPSSVLRTLEFLLSMLQLANKDGRIEEVVPLGKGLLSITRGTKQLDAYIISLLKNTNRVLLFCFLPSFLAAIGEDDLLFRLGLLNESTKRQFSNYPKSDMVNDIGSVLHLIISHRRLIFCPSNIDTDLSCCLCVNIIYLLYDQRKHVHNAAIDVLKYMLVNRRTALEDMLVSKPSQGLHIDVLRNGFDLLLTKSLTLFLEWFHNSEAVVRKVLEQSAAIMWFQFIAGSAKFPGLRIKAVENYRKREMGRRLREISKLDLRHYDQLIERRYALDMVRDAMSTELRVVRQDKYGWILHAESEWQIIIEQLVHERGIFPLPKLAHNSPEWEHCSIEGPYRMRKKLKRTKLSEYTIQNFLDSQFEYKESELFEGQNADRSDSSHAESDSFLHHLTENVKEDDAEDDLYMVFAKQSDTKDVVSVNSAWNDDRASSMNETSLHSALDFGLKSSQLSVPISYSTHENNETGTPRQSSNQTEESKGHAEKSTKDFNDNGEYLIRPFLEPLEKIKFRYNCERVVGLDKHDGVFLIGELCLYVIENFFIDDIGCICEKVCEDELSVIDQALGVKKETPSCGDFQSKSSFLQTASVKTYVGGRAWAYNGGAWGKEKICSSSKLAHPWQMWKLNSVHEILKRDYQLRPVAVEIFSMDGCNDLLVFHKKEREEVFKNLLSMNLPRNSMLDTTISGSMKQEGNEGSRFFKLMAKSFSKRWQTGEISNFQYLMHLNTLAGRGYSDLTQYPVFPWILADYESETLDLLNPITFRKLDKPMGCQTPEGEDEFKKRYESWDDPEVPKFHYGSHYSSAGIVLFYLLRLPPFSVENQKLQGGQFDHADRLFNSIKDTWHSAAGKGNTSDVKELIPEFFYMPEFLENRFNLDLGEKQSGEKVGDVLLPKWAKGSAREFIRMHREALESDYVSENMHHWIDLIFGYKQRGKAAEEAMNVFYHYTYEGSVDIDSVRDPAMKASILAQINHFGQTPKQLFLKPHVKRQSGRKLPPHPLKFSTHLVPREVRQTSSSISQIVSVNEKILVMGLNTLLKPRTFTKYVSWGFPDCSLRIMSYDQDKLLSTHENLHDDCQIQCVGISHDGQIIVTGADDGVVSVWRITKNFLKVSRQLQLEKSLSGHTAKITSLRICQPYMLIVSGSDDCSVIMWDLSSLVFVRQLPVFPVPISAIYVNDLTGEILTAAGVLLAVWSINGDCLAVINTSQLPSDSINSVTSCTFSDWKDISYYVTGHQSGAVKVWQLVHHTIAEDSKPQTTLNCGLNLENRQPEYKLTLKAVLKSHKHPVTALLLTSDLKQLLSGDSSGRLLSWTLQDDNLLTSANPG